MSTTLDWKWFMEAVNKKENSSFTDPCEMMAVLYERFGGQTGIANYLGIARRTAGIKLHA